MTSRRSSAYLGPRSSSVEQLSERVVGPVGAQVLVEDASTRRQAAPCPWSAMHSVGALAAKR